MIKPTPNPPDHFSTSPYESPGSKKHHDAVKRALDHHFPPTEPESELEPDIEPPKEKASLFRVTPGVHTETLLANASEDLLAISAIAVDLADTVDGSRRSVALAISRIAEGVHLLVERALDHLDDPDMAAIFARQEKVAVDA